MATPLTGATVGPDVRQVFVGQRVPGVPNVNFVRCSDKDECIGSIQVKVVGGTAAPVRVGNGIWTDAEVKRTPQLEYLWTPAVGSSTNMFKMFAIGTGPASLTIQWWNRAGGTRPPVTLTFNASLATNPGNPTPIPPIPDADLQ